MTIKHDAAKEHLDANEVLFFQRELESIESRIYNVVKRPLKFRQHIPVDNAEDPGANTLTYRMYDQIGMAKIIGDYADDLPTAEAFATEYSIKVRTIGVAVKYSTQEIRSAAYANKPLDMLKVDSAKRANEEKLNSICWNGDDEYGAPGVLNNANITSVAAAAGATTSTIVWSTKNATEILWDVAKMVETIRSNSKGAFEGNTLLLPITQYNRIATLKMGVDSDKTVLQHILDNKGFGISEIDWVSDLASAFTGGTEDGAFFYAKDPEVLQFRIPMEITPRPVQPRNLSFIIPMETRAAGVTVRYPIACMFFTGI